MSAAADEQVDAEADGNSREIEGEGTAIRAGGGEEKFHGGVVGWGEFGFHGGMMREKGRKGKVFP